MLIRAQCTSENSPRKKKISLRAARKILKPKQLYILPAETVNSDSIPARVNPKTKKIGIRYFLAWRSAIKRIV